MRAAAVGIAAAALGLVTRALARLPLAPRRAGPPPDLRTVRAILVVRLDELGDAVMTTAFLRELRRAAPSSRVTLVVNPATRPLFETCPHVDELLTMRVATPVALRPFVLPWRAWRVARRARRAVVPDLALLPRWGTDAVYATHLAYFSGARVRVGFSERVDARKRRLNRGYDRLLTHPLPFAGWRHEVEHTLALLRAVGAEPADDTLELWPDAADQAFAARALAAAGAGGGPLVALCPSGGHSALKQWPAERFALLADRLRTEFGARVVLVGGPGETVLAEAIARECVEAPASLVGTTTVRQLAAVLRGCALYVGNDAGPLHVAAAVGTPVVAVYGSSDPTRFGPWQGEAQVVWRPPPCAPVYRPDRPDRCPRCVLPEPVCLTGVSVGDVMDACRAALNTHPRLAGGSTRATVGAGVSAELGDRR